MTNQKAPEYKLTNHSFVIKNSSFTPSDSYDHKLVEDNQNNKMYVNLKTLEQRKIFFDDLKKHNDDTTKEKVRARELSYEYFVRSVQSDDKKISFKDIIDTVFFIIYHVSI